MKNTLLCASLKDLMNISFMNFCQKQELCTHWFALWLSKGEAVLQILEHSGLRQKLFLKERNDHQPLLTGHENFVAIFIMILLKIQPNITSKICTTQWNYMEDNTFCITSNIEVLYILPAVLKISQESRYVKLQL